MNLREHHHVRVSAERGTALTMAIATALLSSLAAYAILFVIHGQATQAQFFENRTVSQHLAEAGLIIAMQQLMKDPNYPDASCATTPADKTVTEYVDTNNDGVAAAPDPAVQITVTNCGAGRDHVLKSKVTYY